VPYFAGERAFVDDKERKRAIKAGQLTKEVVMGKVWGLVKGNTPAATTTRHFHYCCALSLSSSASSSRACSVEIQHRTYSISRRKTRHRFHEECDNFKSHLQCSHALQKPSLQQVSESFNEVLFDPPGGNK